MNVILCGMMGSGKTTVGKSVALVTGKQWLDTDDIIVSRHGKISEIFSTHGEEYFRGLEKALVEELSIQDGLVISTGGGLVLQPVNVENLQKTGKIVFLRAKVSTLVDRLQGDMTRPLLKGGELKEKIERLLTVREPLYEKAANYVVDVDDKTVEQIADEIVCLIEKE